MGFSMTDKPATPQIALGFVPEYAGQIAHGCNLWAMLEYYINNSIWALADIEPAIGACMTSQMYTMNARLSALLALLKLRRADQKIIDKVNKFAANVRDAQDARNRLAHDMWLLDRNNPGTMGKLRITADKTLNFDISAVSIEELKNDVGKISARRLEFAAIRDEIMAALPTLPEIPQEELHLIAHNQIRPQTPSSE
jgi:hypothetical protein